MFSVSVDSGDGSPRTRLVRGDPLRDLPEWFEEFMENLVDERVLLVHQLQSREEKWYRASTEEGSLQKNALV